MNRPIFEALKARFKKPGLDVTLDHGRQNFTHFQPKLDGWWSVLEVVNGEGTVYSVGRRPMHTYKVDLPDCILIGEYIYGTNRAVELGYAYQSFVAFDINGPSSDYLKRYAELTKYLSPVDVFGDTPFPQPVTRVDMFDMVYLPWGLEQMKAHNIEGLVFRSSQELQQIHRYKPLFTQDYICVGFNEGLGALTGVLGSIQGAKYINGKLIKVCNVGGGFTYATRVDLWQNRSKYIGRVFEAEGRQLFSTGALRHPVFLRWREDVVASEVTWPK